jgi:hypothetical protein
VNRAIRNSWNGSLMTLFAEKVILSAAVPILVLLAVNPMGWDWQQRLSAGIAIIALAYLIAHTLEKRRTLSPLRLPNVTPQQNAITPPSPKPKRPDSYTTRKQEKPLPNEQKPSIHIEQHGTTNAATVGPNSPITINTLPVRSPERILSQEAFGKLISALSATTEKPPVHVRIVPADQEAADFGMQIVNAFNAAGWKVGSLIGGLSGTIFTNRGALTIEGNGFQCWSADSGQISAVLRAFESVNLECIVSEEAAATIQPGYSVAILVGKRP